MLHLLAWWAVIAVGVDVSPLFEYFSIAKPPPAASSFAAAYLVHKLLVPVRLALITAVLARYGKRIAPYITRFQKRFT